MIPSETRFPPIRGPGYETMYCKGQTQIPLWYGTVPSYGRKRYTAHSIPLGGPETRYQVNLEAKEYTVPT